MKRTIAGLVLTTFFLPALLAQVRNDYEAKAFLIKNGIYAQKIIESAEFIIIRKGQIKPYGGIDVPIITMISPDRVIYLQGASGYVTQKKTVFIEADNFRLAGVLVGMGMQERFFVGESITEIVNFLIQK